MSETQLDSEGSVQPGENGATVLPPQDESRAEESRAKVRNPIGRRRFLKAVAILLGSAALRGIPGVAQAGEVAQPPRPPSPPLRPTFSDVPTSSESNPDQTQPTEVSRNPEDELTQPEALNLNSLGWTTPVHIGQGEAYNITQGPTHLTPEGEPCEVHPTHHGPDQNAIDISLQIGVRIDTTQDGTVLFAGSLGGYGNTVFVLHEDGLISQYSHLSSIDSSVSLGDTVDKGQQIGKSGMTGTTSAHLHFAVFEVTTLGRVKDLARIQNGFQSAGQSILVDYPDNIMWYGGTESDSACITDRYEGVIRQSLSP